MKTRVAALSLLLISAFGGLASQAAAQSAECYVIADATTGHIIDSVDSRKKVQVGSLTKLATAAVVLDWAEISKHDLSEQATVPGDIVNLSTMNPMNLQPGDRLSLKDLLYAALLQSDNIAAATLADHVGRTLNNGGGAPADRFVAQMNALARKLKMDRTLFLNPHGLDSSERRPPYSTAEDIARLTRYALGRSGFRFFILQKERQVTISHETNEPSQYVLKNTNELLGVDGIDGGKTGKTQRAGECLMLTAQQAPESRQDARGVTVTPRRLILVMLGSSDRFNTARRLMARGWELYDRWAQSGRSLKGGTTL